MSRLKLYKKTTSSLLAFLIIFQTVAGIFLPVEVSFSPLEVSLNKAEAAGEGWLSGWSKRKAITLTGGADGAQTDFQLKLAVAYDSDMLSDFSDLRFTKDDGTTLIDAWLEDETDSTSADVWVEFPTTPANTIEQTYYMYYGKADAVDYWDIGETFVFGDDFNRANSSTVGNGWEQQSGGDWEIYDDQLYSSGQNDLTGWEKNNVWQSLSGTAKIIEFKAKTADTDHGIAFDIYSTDENNQYFLLFLEGTFTRLHKTVSGSVSVFDGNDGSKSWASDTWYDIKIEINDQSFKIYADDSLIKEHTGDSSFTTFGKMGFMARQSSAYGVQSYYLDDIRVRKYAASPPTYEFGSEEYLNHLEVTGTGTMTAGGTNEITVAAKTNLGNTYAAYTGAKNLTFTGAGEGFNNSPGGNIPSIEGNNFSSGEATVNNVSFTNGQSSSGDLTMVLYNATANTSTLDVSDTTYDSTGNISYDLDITAVIPASANNLNFSQHPSNAVAGDAISPAIAVEVRDQYNNVRTNDNSTSVGMAINNNPGGGTLSVTTPQTASGGVAAFNDLSIDKTGVGYTLDASSTGLSTITSNSFNITAVGESWLSGYSKRKKITLTGNASGAQTDFQLSLAVAYAAAMQSDFDDLRFTQADGTTLVDAWAEDKTNGASADVWVEFPTTPENGETQTYYMYYGNAAATSDWDFDHTFTKDYGKSGLAGLWHMDDGTSPTTDSSGNGNNGTVNGGATWVGSDGGQWDNRSDVQFSTGDSLSFDGTDDYVDCGNDSSLNITDAITIETWVKWNSTGGYIISKGRYTSESENYPLNYGFRIKDTGYLQFAYSIGSHIYRTDNVVVNENEYTHVAVSFTYGTGSSIKLYVNGNIVSGSWISGDGSDVPAGNTKPAYIGVTDTADGSLTTFFNGTIDEVRIYNRALSAEEINAHYERRKYAANPPTYTFGNEEYLNHLEVTGTGTMTAGGTNEITVTAKTNLGNTYAAYTGNKSLTFSGPANAPSGTVPTVEGTNIGLATTVNFTNGVSNTSAATLIAYNAETTTVDVSDGSIDSTGDISYDLDMTVNPAALNNFLVEAPASANSGTAFSTTITSRDIYNNTTKQVTGDTTVGVNTGSVNPTTLADTLFTDDGVWTGDITISGITEQPTVTLFATNGAPTGNDTISVLGIPNDLTGAALSEITADSMKLTWTDNSSNEDGFKIEKSTDGISYSQIGTASADVEEYSGTGTTFLDPNIRYWFRVRAYNASGNSDYSTALAKYTLANIPASLSLTADSSTQITASWSANSNSAGTEYYIANTTAGTNSGWTTDTSWISSDLTCGTSYSFKVKARNGDDTKTSYTGSAGVETQSCGGGMPPAVFNPPSPPTPTPDNPESNFSVLINNGAEYTNNKTVTLKLNAGSDTTKMAISNYSDFRNASQISYQKEYQWDILGNPPSPLLQRGNTTYTVYAKFYTQYGVASETVSDSIILDTQPPEIKIADLKEYYNTDEVIILSGTTEAGTKIAIRLNGKYFSGGIVRADNSGNWILDLGKLSEGVYKLEIKGEDKAGNIGRTLAVDLTIKEKETPKITVRQELTPEKAKEIIKEIPEILKPFTPEILKPEKSKKKPKEKPEKKQGKIITVPEKAPIALNGQWQLLPREPIKKFVLDPLPRGIESLAKKFPKLEKTFKEVGISKASDLSKLKNIELTLPGLAEIAGLPETKMALPKEIKIADLPKKAKENIPEEIVFVKTGGELIDIGVDLAVTDKGLAQQKFSAVANSYLTLAVKPESKANNVRGYLAFKSGRKNQKLGELKIKKLGNWDDIVGSIVPLGLWNPNAKRQEEISHHGSTGLPAGQTLWNQRNNIRELLINEARAKEMENKLVLQKFEYADPDGDGIYTAKIKAPAGEGEYEIITMIEYEDPELGTRAVKLTAVIDPEGYVYERIKNQELRIKNAVVSLFWLNPQTNKYERWLSEKYQQKNPQTTDATGKYLFLVPEGTYYLKAEAPGYLAYQSESFEVKEDKGVHINIELKTKYGWLKGIDWKVVLLILVTILLAYNFYRDRRRKLT